jgi:hypothetical protein
LKSSQGAQNKKTRPDAPGTAKNKSGSAKNEKQDLTPFSPPKMIMGAQNMKTRPDAFGTAENESEHAKHENGTRHPRYRRKRLLERKTWKRDPTPSVPPKMSLGTQNMKTGPDALGTVENESGHTKHENETRRPRYCLKWVRKRKTWKRDPTPSLPSKMSPGAQNMKTGPGALGTVENEFGAQNMKTGPDDLSTIENEFGAQNMKTGPDVIGTVGNESESAKYENETWHPRYRRKYVYERKTWKQDGTPSVSQKMSLGAQNMKTGPDAIGTAENE